MNEPLNPLPQSPATVTEKIRPTLFIALGGTGM